MNVQLWQNRRTGEIFYKGSGSLRIRVIPEDAVGKVKIATLGNLTITPPLSDSVLATYRAALP
jgi:hypothetical protein